MTVLANYKLAVLFLAVLCALLSKNARRSGEIVTLTSIPRSTTTTQGNTWRGLTPLRSNREEVEKVLGTPKDSVGKIFIYDTETEKVHVWYSEGVCKASEMGQWNVPLGTMLQIRVYPKSTILLRDLQLDMSKYKRIPDPNIPNWAIYRDQDKGVMVQIQLENGCEQVEILTYEPKKDDSHLRCPSSGRSASKRLFETKPYRQGDLQSIR